MPERSSIYDNELCGVAAKKIGFKIWTISISIFTEPELEF